MAQLLSQSLLSLIAAAALAARGGGAAPIVIEDFAGPVDAFFLDDGSAAGLPSSGASALEKVEDGLTRGSAREPGSRAQRRATLGEKGHLSPYVRARSTRSVSLSLKTTLPLGIATVPHSP